MSAKELTDMRTELKAQGIGINEISQALEQHKCEEFELLSGSEKIFDWFIETEDLYRFTNDICLGLDVVAVKADAELSERSYSKNDYQLLREMGKTAAVAMNEQRQK